MRVLQRLVKSRSSCSAFQQSLPPRSVWQRFNTVLTAVGFPFSNKLACPSGASCPLFLAGSHFFPSSALFALHCAVSAISHGLGVQFCATFAHPIRISSSTTSLRNSWAKHRQVSIVHPVVERSWLSLNVW